jgi:hypothetical protein
MSKYDSEFEIQVLVSFLQCRDDPHIARLFPAGAIRRKKCHLASAKRTVLCC